MDPGRQEKYSAKLSARIMESLPEHITGLMIRTRLAVQGDDTGKLLSIRLCLAVLAAMLVVSRAFGGCEGRSGSQL